jgi:hypothetical protein
MNCREWEEAIALYAAGDLDEQRGLDVERHLGACPGCQIFASGMLECLEAVRVTHRQKIPEAHFTAVRTRVLAKLQIAPWWRRGWARAAAVAVLAGAVLWLAMVSWIIRKPTAEPKVAFVRPPVPAMALVAAPAPDITSRPAVLTRHRRRTAAATEPLTEPLTVRILTDDPTVVIYWLANPKGE